MPNGASVRDHRLHLASKRKVWGIQQAIAGAVLNDLSLKNTPIPTVYFLASSRHYCLYPEPNGTSESRVANTGKASVGSTKEIYTTAILMYLQLESSYPDRRVPEGRG